LKVRFKKSFARDLQAVKDKVLLDRIKAVIDNVEKAKSLADVTGLKKLRAGTACYRIRVADYRVGLAVEADEIVFVTVLHRREIYRYFP